MKKLMIVSLLFSNMAFANAVDCSKVKTIDQQMTMLMSKWIDSNGRSDLEAAVLHDCLVLVDKENSQCAVSSKSVEQCAYFLNLGKKNLQ